MSLQDLSLLLLVLSVAAFVSEIALIIKYFAIKKNSYMSFRSKLFRLAAVLILSIWSLRLFVEVSAENEAWAGFNFIEKLLDSFVHTFQTFSLDEDYTVYTNIGKDYLAKRFTTDIVAVLYGLYSSVINVMAPVLGGGLLFEILTSFFPKFRLVLACQSRRKKYVFSELNEQSVALAKSIKKEDPLALLIYTDTYVDPTNERETELYAEAKRENAVCVKDDICNVLRDTKIGMKGHVECFLIDENEYNNLTALASIVSDKASRKKLRKNKLKIFHTSKIESLIEEKAIWNMYLRDKAVDSTYSKSSDSDNEAVYSQDTEQESVDIQFINCYRLIVWDLFFKCPLYTPLLSKKAPRQLNLTVIGAGSIGMESFLAATWFGQMLNGNGQNIHLNISIINNEPFDKFIKGINAINPEILMQSQEKSPLLKIRANMPEDGDFGETYYTLYYSEENIETADLEKLRCRKVCCCEESGYNLSDETACFADSDYIVVALGSDSTNILIAESIKKQFAYHKAVSGGENTQNNIDKVIGYAVYDDNVNDLLMNDKKYEQENGILMYAFANLSDIYNYDKISAGRFTESAKFTQYAYDSANASAKKNSVPTEEEALYKKNYNYWSTIARNFDFFYKIYSAFGQSFVPLFDDYSKAEELMERFIEEFEVKSSADLTDPKKSFLRRLMWQEHRRWNAYMRQLGYKSAPLNVSKNFKYKWHNCIGECDDRYFDDPSEISAPDHLDDIFKNTKIDYKIYDFPCRFDSEKNEAVWEEGLIDAYKRYKNIS